MSGPVLGRNMLVFAAAVVLATLVAALWVMDSPAQQREKRLDARRVNDLQQIENQVDAWALSHTALPASLAELKAQPGVAFTDTDPTTGAAYEYSVISARGYRLCAVFSTDSAKDERPRGDYGVTGTRWVHPAGRHCFERKVKFAEDAATKADAAARITAEVH